MNRESTLNDMAVKSGQASKLYRWLINRRNTAGCCFLCRAEPGPVCHGCFRDLPRNDDACPACALPATGGMLCGECLQTAKPALDRVIAPYRYDYPINRIIQAFKFNDRTGVASIFADAFQAMFESGLIELPDMILPIPLHRSRLQSRGYNQAGLLAQAVAERLGAPLDSHSLVRSRHTLPQFGLNKKQRRRNVKRAFEFQGEWTGRCRYVVLLDDVMTTGATLREAASELKRAGAERVEAWVCARAGQA
jgi:ComF family protein